MKDQPVLRDERTISVENASYKLGFTVILFGLLIIITFRGFFYQESNWDLLALVIIGSGVTTVYQAINRTLSQRWFYLGLTMAAIAAVVAFVISLLMQ